MFRIIYLVAFLVLGSLGNSVAAAKALAPKDQKALSSAFEQYEKLHQAFFDYNGKKVEASAKALAKDLESIEDAELAKLLKFSKVKLKEIAAGGSRMENNQNLHLISLALIHVMKNYPVGENYRAFNCPMVKKKWIQDVGEVKVVQNPYAPEMPNCGSIDN